MKRDDMTWIDPVNPTTEPPRRVFPTEAFPEVAAKYITELAAHFQVDKAMPGTAVLAAMGSALVGRVEVSEDRQEPALIWTAVVAKSGDLKSPVARTVERALVLPVEKAARDADEAPRGMDREAAENKHEDAVKAVKELERRLARERAKEDNQAAVEAAEAALAEAREAEHELRVRPVPRLVVDDMTPEALHQRMAENHGRLTAWIVEGTGLFHKLSGKDAANVAPWLAAADGDPIRAARVTADRPDVDSARLTLCMFVQPKVLADGITGDALSYNGFHNRFLYAAPVSHAGRRIARPPRVDAFTEGKLATRLQAVTRELWNLETPRLLRLSADAQARFDERFLEVDRAQGSTLADDDPIAEMTSKLLGKTLRIAGVFALVDNPQATEVSREWFLRAEAVANFYHAEAWALWGHMLTASGEARHLVRSMARVVLKYRDKGVVTSRDFNRYGSRPLRRHLAEMVCGDTKRENPAELIFAEAIRHLIVCGWIANPDGYRRHKWAVSPRLGDFTVEDLT
ncbi:DUF3987 domain-containing protein [Gordonia sp. NPDC003950]